MTRLIRGSVLLAACVGLWACGTDSTSSEAGKPFKIVSLPSVVFVKTDSSQLITFQLVDELDGQIPTTWTLSASSPNFTVALDSSYRPVYNADGSLTLPSEQTEVRATITGTALLGISEFTVSAGGKTLTIPVNVVPGTLYATFSPANPAPGDTVTMTMPPSLRLTPTSRISFPVITKSTTDTNSVRALVIAPDSMSATFIAAPTVDTTARVTNVVNVDFPTIAPVTLTTQTKITGTQSGTFDGNLPATITPASSPGSPVAGNITVTLNPVYAFKSTAPASVFTFPTQTAPILGSISADSTVAVMAVGPNVASPLQATRVTFKGAPQFEYSLVSADSVYTEVITNFPGLLSNPSPMIGELVSIAALGGFTFNTTLGTVSWPLNPNAIVTSRTAGTITLYPYPGSAGNNSAVSGVIAASAPAFQLTLPSVLNVPLSMSTSVAPGVAGTDAFGTAPMLQGQGIVDAASFGCVGCGVNGFDAQIYQYTAAAAGAKTVTLTWSNNSDLGLYFQSTAGGPPVITTGCDAHGNGATAQPETCSVNFPAAGTYYFNVENFAPAYPDPDPTWIAIRIQ